ncbi:metallophosphoesterase [Pedobacter alpinus]|uniref:Metallophosphoesterase n=1 Tax=Pedobacter alpinus TaxID=1590643 RepID=A0ABW5TPP0_9SPHI
MGKIIGLSFVALLLIAFDLYIYKAILNIYPNRSSSKKQNFKVLWWGYTLIVLLGVFVSLSFNIWLSLKTIFLVAYFITFVTKLVWSIILFVDDIRRGAVFVKRKVITENDSVTANENTIPRSEFLVKAGMAVAAVPFASLSWGVISGAYDYRVRKQALYFANLPKEFDGIKLAQISDVHSGSFYNKKAVLGGVEMLMNQKPDFVFFTGDLVNGKASEMRDYQDVFSKIKAPLGVYSVLGNHDYGMYEKWKNAAAQNKNLEDVKKTHQLMGWDLLMNENRSLKVDGAEIGVLGIENWGGGRFPKFGKMEEAIKNTDDFPVKLLLSHDPSHWRAEVLEKYPQIDASFAGHTHGAQFGIETEYVKWSPVQYVYDEWDGLYKEGNQQLYVNVGYGFLGYPGRVGILPEITIFELKRG